MKQIMIKLCSLLFFTGITLSLAQAKEGVEDFHHDYYQQLCKRYISCADYYPVAETLMLAKIKDVNDCVKMLTRRDSAKSWQKAYRNQEFSFVPKAIPSCLSDVAKLECQVLARNILKATAIPSCKRVIVAKVKHKPCTTHLSCQGTAASCVEGECYPPMLMECGKAMCSDNQYCDMKKMKCITLKPAGKQCSNFSECLTGNCGASGKCENYPKVKKAGEPCGGSQSPVCELGHYCSDNGKCVKL